MIGWIFGIDILTRILDLGVNMSFPAAFMFLISSIGLLYIYRTTIENDYLFSPIVLSGVTLLIFLVNITVLTSTVISIQTGMENLFISAQDYELLNTRIAGRPAYPTMLGFTFFGISSIFSLVLGAKREKLIGLFGIPIFLLGLIALIGYMFHIPLMYYKFGDISVPMALNTALTFIIMGICMFIIRVSKPGNET